MRIKLFLFFLILLAGAIAMADNAQAEALPNEKEFEINGSMGKLYALMALPDLAPDEKCPMVILSHGFRGNLNYHLWPKIIKILNSAGIGTLRFDFNGAGKSEGEFVNMTVPNEIEDLMAVISFVRSQPATASISLVGHSQGGVVSGMAAGICGASQIRNLVLLSAAAVLRDDALRGNTQGTIYDPWHLDKPWYPLVGDFKLGRSYIQTAMNLPIYDTSAKYHGPALVMNGMADRVVPYTYAELYKKNLPQAELVIVPGEDHSWTVDPDYAVKLVCDWLLARLSGKSQDNS